MKLTIKKDSSDGRVTRARCNKCSSDTKHDVLASVSEFWDDEDPDYSIQGNVDHEILCCCGCETFTYRSVSTNSEDVHIVNNRGDAEHTETVNYFPPRFSGRSAIRDASLLPSKLESIYIETLSAHNANQLILTAMGLRAMIETICKDHDAEGKNLEQRIDGLSAKGIITEAARNILHRVRFIGNDAAHEVKPADRETLGFAIEAVEHTLIGTYVLPEREKLAFKKDERKAKPLFPAGTQKADSPTDIP